MEIPQSVAHLIAVNKKFGVLLCRSARCRHALTVKGLEDHLRKLHVETLAVRREAKEFAQALARQDARFQRDHTGVELPIDGSAPQPTLPVTDGFRCLFCHFLTISRAKMRTHSNKEHSKKGKEDDCVYARVKLQSWFGWKRERYWVVRDVISGLGEAANGQGEATRGPDDATRGAGDATTGFGEGTRTLSEATRGLGDAMAGSGEVTRELGEATTGLDDAANELDGIKEDIQRWRDEATERRLKLVTMPLVFELDSWLNYTKWHAVLSRSRYDMLQTYDFLRFPGPKETRLRHLLRAWNLIKTRALDTLEDVDHKDTLKWWVSPKNEVASQHPFELPQSSRTLDKYSRIWEQFICYMVRTVPADSDEGTETGVVYTKEQRQAIENIQGLLDDDLTSEGLPALADELMQLCRLVITQDLSAAKLYDSPLMHYLAVRGIDKKAEGFRGPMEYTNILAGVLWILQLLALELAIPSRPWPELGIPGKGELGKEKLASVGETIKTFRLAHLVEGLFSPASSILTQLAKGQKDNSVHHSPANIHWSQDRQTVYFAGRPVHLAKIGPMGQALVEELRESLLTLAFEEELPTIQLGQVVDSTAWTQQFRKAQLQFYKTCRK